MPKNGELTRDDFKEIAKKYWSDPIFVGSCVPLLREVAQAAVKAHLARQEQELNKMWDWAMQALDWREDEIVRIRDEAVVGAVKQERESLFQKIEEKSRPQATNMYGISLSQEDWQSIRQE